MVRTTRVRVELRGVAPVVMRVLDVPASVTLPELHELFQVAMGWTDSHLHLFVTGGVEYGAPGSDGPRARACRDRGAVGRAAGGFVYLYDFGDDWRHDVEVLGHGGDRAGCVYGEGECPDPDETSSDPTWPTIRDYLVNHYADDGDNPFWDENVWYRIDPSWMVAYSADPVGLLDQQPPA